MRVYQIFLIGFALTLLLMVFIFIDQHFTWSNTKKQTEVKEDNTTLKKIEDRYKPLSNLRKNGGCIIYRERNRKGTRRSYVFIKGRSIIVLFYSPVIVTNLTDTKQFRKVVKYLNDQVGLTRDTFWKKDFSTVVNIDNTPVCISLYTGSIKELFDSNICGH